MLHWLIEEDSYEFFGLKEIGGWWVDWLIWISFDWFEYCLIDLNLNLNWLIWI